MNKLRQILVDYLNITGISTSNAEKGARVIGLASHLLGDSFAH